ncbi:MAG TPA: S8 family serine peptidase [Bryobacteraceae bacterium]|nr:S8 family serine peptidase [Bryobacteraceae bacterium]
MPAFSQLVANRYTLLLNDPPVSARFATRVEMQSAAAVQYRAQMETRQRAVLSQLASRNVAVTGHVTTLLNAIFVVAPPSRVPELQAIPGVAAVRPMRHFKMLLNRAVGLMNGPAAWALPAIGGQSNAGKGMKIAIIDTGVDQTHPAFQDSSLTMPAGFPICTTGHPEDCAFTNSKVIVARSYVRQLAGFTSKTPDSPTCATNLSCSNDNSVAPPPATSQPDDYTPRDHIGHGTATASAAAGNQNTGTVAFTGMAPKAYLGNYKIFGSPGVNDLPTDDVMILAIEDALKDGMDVASMSIGGPAFSGALDAGAACGIPAGQPCDPVAFAFETAAKAGMVIVVAAGNAGSDTLAVSGNYPYFNSINSPADAPSVITVGATTNSHALTPVVSVAAAGAPANVKNLAAQLTDATFFPSQLGASSGVLVDITTLGNDGTACSALPAGSLKGKWALVMRGTGTNCLLSDKATNVALAGGLGAVFYMSDATPPSIATGLTFDGPAVSISNTDGLALKSYLAANPGALVTIDVAGQEMDLSVFNGAEGISPPIAPNQVASYSSFGPAPDGTIKPDLVATGGLDVNLSPAPGMYVATQNYDPTLGPQGNLYSANRYAAADGTSFATPLVAGAAALIKQAHPTYTAGQVKSALVNSAAQDTTTDDGYIDVNGIQQPPRTVNVQWLGAGRLDAAAALKATVTAEPATVSFGYLAAGALPITKALTITNKGAASATITVAVAPNGAAASATVATDKQTLTIAAGASATLNVTLSGSVPSAGSYSGAVTLSVAGALAARIPYLFLVPDGVPYNFFPYANTGLQGTPGQDVGWIAVQVIDQYGVPVSGNSVPFTVRPAGAVTLKSVAGQPACTIATTVTCPTNKYGYAFAEVVLGPTPNPTSSITITATVNGIPMPYPVFILPQAVVTPGQVLDNAAFQPVVAPGSIAAIKGSNLMDPGLLVNTAQGYDLLPPALTAFPFMFEGVNVSFDVPGTGISVPAPIVAVSVGQIDVQVPWELKGQTSAQVKVVIDEYSGPPVIYSSVVTAQLSDYTPAFFSNGGIAAALDQNYQPINNSNPALRGQYIALYANGLGPVANTPADGAPAGLNATTTTPCVISIGGQTLPSNQVVFCGLAPGLAVYQINVQVPAGLTPGNQPVTVTIGGKTSPAGIIIPVQ